MMRMIMRTIAPLAALAWLPLAAPPAAAAVAHPLGNFSVNHHAGLLIASDAIRVRFVVDLAEIPSVPVLRQVDPAGRGTPAEPGRSRYTARCGEYARDLLLRLDGRRRPLAVTSTALFLLPGNGGLRTVRLECELAGGAGPAAGTRLEFRDDTDAGRPGWREITARGDRRALRGSTVPERSPSDALTRYPADRLHDPPRVRAASMTVAFGGSAEPEPAAPCCAAEVRRAGDALAALADRNTGAFLVSALLAAILLGAAHALAPGHGKTVMAAYLLGRRGTLGHAMAIGLTVTLTHTLGVLLLAALISGSALAAPERVYSWLNLATGLLLAAIGVAMLRPRRHEHAAPAHADHVPADRPKHDPRDHDARDGVVPGARRPRRAGGLEAARSGGPGGLGWRGVVPVGVVGGLAPSPSAVLVLLAAVAAGRAAYGFFLVLAYGAGMAGCLAGVGWLIGRAGGRLGRWAAFGRPGPRGLPAGLPRYAAALVVVSGGVVMIRGIAGL